MPPQSGSARSTCVPSSPSRGRPSSKHGGCHDHPCHRQLRPQARDVPLAAAAVGARRDAADRSRTGRRDLVASSGSSDDPVWEPRPGTSPSRSRHRTPCNRHGQVRAALAEQNRHFSADPAAAFTRRSGKFSGDRVAIELHPGRMIPRARFGKASAVVSRARAISVRRVRRRVARGREGGRGRSERHGADSRAGPRSSLCRGSS
jgi:hypothetical protein